MTILSQFWNRICHKFAPEALIYIIRVSLKKMDDDKSQLFLKDTYYKSVTIKKYQAFASFYGRSMVEMLGVLAIIGVLSIGAISGYQNAMMKYKLNKHAEAFNILLNNALQVKEQLGYSNSELTYYGDLFHKLNYIPDGFKYINNLYLTDTFNNQMWIYQYEGDNRAGGIGIKFQPTSEGKEICRNIVLTARENRANLKRLATYKYYNDKPLSEEGNIFGDAYCRKDNECLKDLTLEHISRLCNICDEKQCTLYVLWK